MKEKAVSGKWKSVKCPWAKKNCPYVGESTRYCPICHNCTHPLDMQTPQPEEIGYRREAMRFGQNYNELTWEMENRRISREIKWQAGYGKRGCYW
jgi:hypothetical protein